MQRYLWQQADGQRHVYDVTTTIPQGAQPFVALCGETVTPAEHEIHHGSLPLWLDPTCQACDTAIHALLGIPTQATSTPRARATR